MRACELISGGRHARDYEEEEGAGGRVAETGGSNE